VSSVTAQTIARLEALLERVRTRAVEPRTVAVAAAAVSPEPVTEVVVAREVIEEAEPVAAPPPPAPVQVPEPPPVSVLDLDEPADELESTQQRAVPSRGAPMRTETDIVMEVEVQATTPESVLAVPVDEGTPPEPLDSRERLVAAAPAAVEPPIEMPTAPVAEPEPAPIVAVQEQQPVVELTVEAVEVVEVVEAEEAPVSSRRPVAPPPEERLDEMAFGAVEPQPMRHTPPPESGRLPAAPDVEFDGDITGVRNASKSAHPVVVAPIVPEATIADLAPSDEVADVVGAAQAPEPTTFVGVLDQSMAL
jgi:hypothetical protein